MKKLCLLITTALITVSSCFTAFAGQWQQDGSGWRYQNDDGSYPNNGWNWINGKCYYFNPDTYCLLNTQTPDGYTVNAEGAWIVDGVVQTQAQSSQTSADIYTVGNMKLSAPDGFYFYQSQDEYYVFESNDQQRVITAGSSDIGIDPRAENFSEDLINSMLDEAMAQEAGAYSSRTSVQLTSGAWVRYDYATVAALSAPGTMTAYIRVEGPNMQLVLFAGNLSATNTDELMNNLIK